MSEATYIPLETSLQQEYDELVALVEFDIDFDLLDISSSIGHVPDNLILMTGLHRSLAMFYGNGEEKAWQTAYRGFFFAHEIAQLAGEHEFVIDIPKMISFLTTDEQLQYEIREFLDLRPKTNAFIDYFLDDITIAKDGLLGRIAKISAGLSFMAIEDAMYESYLTQQAAQLELDQKLQK